MMNQEEINNLKKITLRRLREKVGEIKSHLPKDFENIITYSKNFTLSLSNYCQNYMMTFLWAFLLTRPVCRRSPVF